MRRIGIEDPALQIKVMGVVMDRFNAMLESVADQFPGVKYVDARGAVGDDRWHDELHPENDGFASAADRFVEAIETP